MANASLQSLGKYALICLGIGGTAFWLGSHATSSNPLKKGEIPVEPVRIRATTGPAAKASASLRGFAAPRIDPEATDSDSVALSANPAASVSPQDRLIAPPQSLPAAAPPLSASADASTPHPSADAPTRHRLPLRTHRRRPNANRGVNTVQRKGRKYRDIYDNERVMHDNAQEGRGHYKDVYDKTDGNDQQEIVRRRRNFDEPRSRYRVSDDPRRRHRGWEEGDRN